MSKKKIPSEAELAGASTAAGLAPALDNGDIQTTPRDSLRGSVDFLEHHTLFGCAWDASDHSCIVDVDIYGGDELLDSVPADKYRHDLALAGVGDGRHGFEYRLPADVDPRSVRVTFAHSDIAMSEGPFFRADDSLSFTSDQTLSEMKNALGALEGGVESIAAALRGLESKVTGLGEQTKTVATRQDLGKVHNSLVSPVSETRTKIDEIIRSGNRIEGFLNIELGKRITRELDMDSLRGQVLEIDARLRRASFGRLVIVALLLGLIAAFLLVQPIDWGESLKSVTNWFLDTMR